MAKVRIEIGIGIGIGIDIGIAIEIEIGIVTGIAFAVPSANCKMQNGEWERHCRMQRPRSGVVA